MELKGTRTEQNLYSTFSSEARARTKYNLYAERARVDGYQWVAEIFDVSAQYELAHAREVLRRHLNLIGNTRDNLLDSFLEESKEGQNIYRQFEEEARQEGFIVIANYFKELANAEEEHANTFKELYDKIEDGTMFRGPEGSLWICMNCGYIYEGVEAPLVCPLCRYPRAYFKPYERVSNA